MFLGEYTTTFSGHGRVVLPKKLREGLSTNVIILSRGFEGCIWGFDLKEFKVMAEKQLEVSATEERAREIRRYLFSGSQPADLDSQNRFIIPSGLLSYAHLKGEVVIIGAGDHFEIWDKELWEKHIKMIEEEYGRVS